MKDRSAAEVGTSHRSSFPAADAFLKFPHVIRTLLYFFSYWMWIPESHPNVVDVQTGWRIFLCPVFYFITDHM